MARKVAAPTRDRKKAERVLTTWLVEHADELNVPEEIRALFPAVTRVRAERGSRLSRVDNYFFLSFLMKEKKKWTEADLFVRFGLTRGAMSTKRSSAFKTCPDVESRIWMSFDRDEGVYTFLPLGEHPPESYIGPLPPGYAGVPQRGLRRAVKSTVVDELLAEGV